MKSCIEKDIWVIEKITLQYIIWVSQNLSTSTSTALICKNNLDWRNTMGRECLINKIVEFLVCKGILDISNIDLDVSLSNVYGVDSVSLVEIIIYCEEEFGFEFDYSELDLSNFKSINTLADVIEKHTRSVSL